MKYELTQEFYFEAAHTLTRTIDGAASCRVHGHTYHVEVSLAGAPDPGTGMLIDLGEFRRALEDVRDQLDHRMLDEITALGAPTLENLCRYIAVALRPGLPGLARVTVARRASGDRCTLSCAEG